jgi:hypothetical protein
MSPGALRFRQEMTRLLSSRGSQGGVGTLSAMDEAALTGDRGGRRARMEPQALATGDALRASPGMLVGAEAY